MERESAITERSPSRSSFAESSWQG
jgi:hypothetical protein